MGWADRYIAELKKGKTVEFRPTGRSMEPLVRSGQLVKVTPLTADTVLTMTESIVLCEVKGKQYLHLVWGVDDGKYLIGNNKGYFNGWIHRSQIYGVRIP